MIKICHITSTPQNSIPRLLKESSSAIKMQIKPYIVAQGDSFEKDGVTYIGVKMCKSRLHRMILTSRVLYKKAIEIDADIYQVHDPELLPYAVKLKKKGKVVIFDSHEFYGIQIETKSYIPKVIRKLIAKAYKSFETYVCKKLDAVIAVCKIDGEDYFANRTQKTIFVENMPDSNIFLKNISIKEKKPNSVVYVGALSGSRGITHLTKAITKTSAKLVLCGQFSSMEYFEEIKNTPGFSNIKYRGVVSRNEVVEILNESYIGVSTLLHVGQYSKIDTLPTKVYEYMSLGLPVIISDTLHAKRVIDEYKFGIYVNPENIDEIAQKINYLLENPEIAQQMGNSGMKLIQEKFNWSFEEKKLTILYKELININYSRRE
jgi:glycosyltransferase involved in cell wall biosynthesis